MDRESQRKKITHLRTTLCAFVLATVSFTWSGCSTDTPLDSNGVSDSPQLEDYFPLNSSYGATFVVRDASGNEINTITYSAGSPAVVAGFSGMHWSSEVIDTQSQAFQSIIFNNGSAILQTDDEGFTYEQLIVEPLEVGASWSRWVSSPIDAGSEEDEPGGEDDGGGLGVNDGDENKPLDDDGPLGSSFPTKGSSTFYIASIDDVVSSGGEIYENCLEVVNSGAGSTVNRYWYAPGAGLVRFALDCQHGSEIGAENGELLE